MFYQKMTQNAISAMSRLAEAYAQECPAVSSRDIAESRGMPAPVVAKILTELARAGLVTGSPGPGGGYRLAKPPIEISLKDVVRVFESETRSACPFGPKWCGNEEPCPLHNSLAAMQQIFDDFLRNTTFSVFALAETARPVPLDQVVPGIDSTKTG